MVVDVDDDDGATDDEEEAEKEEAAVGAAVGAVTVEAVGEEVGAEEELLNKICCVVCRSVGGVAEECCPTSADRSPCPGAIPGGKLLGRPPGPFAAKGKEEEGES